MSLFRSELLFKLLTLAQVHRYPFWNLKYADINEFLISAATLYDQQSPVDLKHRIELLVQNSKIPVSLVYGGDEVTVSQYCIEEMYRRMKIKPEEIVEIDPIHDLLDSVKQSKRIQGYRIKGGGHFAHAKYYQYSNQIVENLLNF